MRRLIIIMAIILAPAQVLGISHSDLDAVLHHSELSDPNTTCSGGGVSANGSISPNAGKGMSSTAQQKFQTILVAAGKKYNVDPNFIASFYYAENSRTNDSTNNADSATPPPVTGDGNWREPPPPYGHGSPWQRNGFTATGPFQFIDSTWAQYGVDGNGDGNVDANDLTDAGFAAGKYLAALGATLGSNDSKLKTAAFGYNRSTTYGDSILNTFHYLSGGGQTNVSGSTGTCDSSGGQSVDGYKDPYRDLKNKTAKRIDQGVDYGGEGPVYAIGKGTVNVVYKRNSGSGWPGWGVSGAGCWISYTLSEGPAKGKTVYFAENCTPHVQAGDPVDADTKIADLDGLVESWSETGWASGPAGTATAAAPPIYSEGHATECGRNFSDLLVKLGEKGGTYDHPEEKDHELASCSGWPKW